jgi:hypothetical protein
MQLNVKGERHYPRTGHVSALIRLCRQKRDRLIDIYHVTYPFLTFGYHLVSLLEELERVPM